MIKDDDRRDNGDNGDMGRWGHQGHWGQGHWGQQMSLVSLVPNVPGVPSVPCPWCPFFVLMLLCMSGTVMAEPWGKDADLVYHPLERSSPTNCQTPILGPMGEVLIKFHQEVISPADGPRSNFRPSSSQYMLNAMRKYGFFKGFSMGCDRLMRENEDPWVYRTAPNEAGQMMKWDPVP